MVVAGRTGASNGGAGWCCNPVLTNTNEYHVFDPNIKISFFNIWKWRQQCISAAEVIIQTLSEVICFYYSSKMSSKKEKPTLGNTFS